MMILVNCLMYILGFLTLCFTLLGTDLVWFVFSEKFCDQISFTKCVYWIIANVFLTVSKEYLLCTKIVGPKFLF